MCSRGRFQGSAIMSNEKKGHHWAGVFGLILCVFLSFLVGPYDSSVFGQDGMIKMRVSVIQVKTESAAREVLQRLNAGGDFADLALQYSIGPGKEEGGDMGYFAPGEMVEALNTVATALKVGEYSDIIGVKDHYFILMKTDEGFPEQVNPEGMDAQSTLKVHYEKGRAWHGQGDCDKAIAEYTKVLEIDPTYALAYYHRGNAKYKKGEFSQAIADYTKALELRPQDATICFLRGTAWLKKGDFDQAVTDYTRALEMSPGYEDAFINRGNAFYLKGEFDQAIADYSATLEINDQNAEAFYNRARAWHGKGNVEKSLADSRMAFSLKPGKKEYQEFADSLSEMTASGKLEAKEPLEDSKEPASVSARLVYSLHVASFRKLSSAEKEIERLAEEGIDAWWKKTQVPNKGEWFRVYIGEEESKSETEKMGQRLKSSGIIDSFMVYRVEKGISR
jgi:tetratricopeptide (TPR) repeat protein